MSRRHIFAVLAAGISLVAAGCIDLEYIGQEFEPTPQSRPVALFQNRAEVPPGEYRIIGRATLTAPDGTLGYDIQEKLLDSARNAPCRRPSPLPRSGAPDPAWYRPVSARSWSRG